MRRAEVSETLGVTPRAPCPISARKVVITDMTTLYTRLASLRDENGQGLAEYALILALIAVIAIAALVFLGTQIRTILSQIGANI